jgi:hypothetical protein
VNFFFTLFHFTLFIPFYVACNSIFHANGNLSKVRVVLSMTNVNSFLELGIAFFLAS